MRYKTAAITDAGNVRSMNEDSLLVCRRCFGKEEALLTAVADGMGGLSRGEYASRCVTESLLQWWQREIETRTQEPELAAVSDALGFVIEQSHSRLLAEGRQSGSLMGTTLSLVFVWRGEYLIKQVGDSRVYLLDGRSIYQLTTDQNWCQQEVAAGRMAQEEAACHEKRHILLNAVGARGDFFIKDKVGQLAKRQRLLLCSDGYYAYLQPEELYRRFGHTALQKQLDQSMERIRKGRAEDNLTAVMVEACSR